MSGLVRLIIDNDNIRYSSRVNASTACFINSSYHLWNKDWSGFKKMLSFYDADNKEPLNNETLSDHYGTLYIDWNKKEIHQIQSDYYFSGFFIPTLYFSLNNEILINNFLFNMINPDNSKEISCYYQDGENIFDFNLYFNKEFSTIDIINVIKNYRKIEKDTSILEKYNLSANIDFDLIKNQEIIMVKFPVNNDCWKTFKYDYDFKNGVELTKRILNID